MKKRDKELYNIHCVLYDLTKGHFKSKWLCKHNKHNYQLHTKIEDIPEREVKYSWDGSSIIYDIERHRKAYFTYYKCYCCGKEKEVK